MPPSGCAAWRNRLYVVSSRPSQGGATGGLRGVRGTVPIARPHSPPIKGARMGRVLLHRTSPSLPVTREGGGVGLVVYVHCSTPPPTRSRADGRANCVLNPLGLTG